MSPHLRAGRRLAPLLFSALAACSGPSSGSYRVFELQADRQVRLSDAVDALARADVVFLGEEHDNEVGHRLQLRILELLHDRRPELVLSLEQFEADVQFWLDAYLAGDTDEATFLKHSRPWGNYAEHYRPIVEWARKEGIPVVAANIPRPLASRVSRHGFRSVAGNELTPWEVELEEPRYEELFANAMGGHGSLDDPRMRRFFEAQCLKDEKMAESIEKALASGERPLVVHLGGKFHSDRRLGTVSRLARRRPDVDIAVVSMSSGEDLSRPLSRGERAAGDFLLRVPAEPR
jgi:uncharacterized iron-regulated protein